MKPGTWWLLLTLLVGVLLMTYGHLHQHNLALFAGLLVTLGGVLFGVVRLLRGEELGPGR